MTKIQNLAMYRAYIKVHETATKRNNPSIEKVDT